MFQSQLLKHSVMMNEKLNLSWNEFESCTSNTFKDLLSDEDFADVTLVCDEEKQIKAHKVILSSCSPLFRKILKNNPHPHPLIYLNEIKFAELQSVINFVYLGQTEVHQADLEIFMKAGKQLQIKGLTQNYVPKESTTDVKTEMEMPPSVRSNYSDDANTSQYFEAGFSQNEFEIIPHDIPNDIPNENYEVFKKENFDWQKIKINGKFPCDRCGYETTLLNNLKTHIMAKHEGVKFECEQCPKSFANQPNLIRHRRSVHIVV